MAANDGVHVSRVRKGLYALVHNLKSYDLEQYPDGSWLLFANNSKGEREYLNDFLTKRGAIKALAFGQVKQ